MSEQHKRTMKNECWFCQNKRNIPGNAHFMCVHIDPKITGKEYGIKNGWFNYPEQFDPVWKTKDCANFEEQSNG